MRGGKTKMEFLVKRLRKLDHYHYECEQFPSMTGMSNLSKRSIHELEFHFYGKLQNIHQDGAGIIFAVRVLPLLGLFFIPVLWEEVNLVINSVVWIALWLVGILWRQSYRIYESNRPVGKLVKKRGACYQSDYKKDTYDIAAHSGDRVSVIKNGVQIALIRRDAVAWNNENVYRILYRETCSEEDRGFLFMTCVFCDRVFYSDFDGLVLGPVVSKNIVAGDRYKERAEWTPDV